MWLMKSQFFCSHPLNSFPALFLGLKPHTPQNFFVKFLIGFLIVKLRQFFWLNSKVTIKSTKWQLNWQTYNKKDQNGQYIFTKTGNKYKSQQLMRSAQAVYILTLSSIRLHFFQDWLDWLVSLWLATSPICLPVCFFPSNIIAKEIIWSIFDLFSEIIQKN